MFNSSILTSFQTSSVRWITLRPAPPAHLSTGILTSDLLDDPSTAATTTTGSAISTTRRDGRGRAPIRSPSISSLFLNMFLYSRLFFHFLHFYPIFRFPAHSLLSSGHFHRFSVRFPRPLDTILTRFLIPTPPIFTPFPPSFDLDSCRFIFVFILLFLPILFSSSFSIIFSFPSPSPPSSKCSKFMRYNGIILFSATKTRGRNPKKMSPPPSTHPFSFPVSFFFLPLG